MLAEGGWELGVGHLGPLGDVLLVARRRLLGDRIAVRSLHGGADGLQRSVARPVVVDEQVDGVREQCDGQHNTDDEQPDRPIALLLLPRRLERGQLVAAAGRPGVPLPLGADGLVLTATGELLGLGGGKARRVYLGRLSAHRLRQIDVEQRPQQLGGRAVASTRSSTASDRSVPSSWTSRSYAAWCLVTASTAASTASRLPLRTCRSRPGAPDPPRRLRNHRRGRRGRGSRPVAGRRACLGQVGGRCQLVHQGCRRHLEPVAVAIHLAGVPADHLDAG